VKYFIILNIILTFISLLLFFVVRVQYTPIVGQGPSKYSNFIRNVSLKKEDDVADFVEATVFSRNECVVMEANFVKEDEIDTSKINNVGWWFKKWFYTHVRDMLKDETQKVIIEYIPTYQYIFRHNRGIFWTLRDQLPERYGNNVIFRYLLGWLNPPQVTFLKMPATPKIKKEMMIERVYQDIVLPLSTLEEAIELAGDLFEIWPILVYPSRIYDHGKDMQGQVSDREGQRGWVCVCVCECVCALFLSDEEFYLFSLFLLSLLILVSSTKAGRHSKRYKLCDVL
jgi:hypothetical protein